jgi:hypothetical protein
MKLVRAMPVAAEAELEELRMLHALNRQVDSIIEESLREHASLTQTFHRLLPVVMREAGAQGVAVTTRNEELVEETFHTGDFGGVYPGTLLAGALGTRREGEGTVVSQELDVVGQPVGRIGLYLVGDHTGPEQAGHLERLLDTVAEQLDTVLMLVQTASEKQELILQLNRLLANPVFEVGMDQVVLALAQRVRVPGFLLVYRDALRPSVLHYRSYRNGHLEHESGEQPLPVLDAVLRAHGPELLARGDERLKRALGEPRMMEAVLIAGHMHSEPLGRILLWSGEEGFSSYTMDLVRVLASTLSQRLVDYNRERTHLSQFFSAEIIDELVQSPDYGTRYLTSRDEEVGILFADINGFTRLCEQLESPTRIGRFVDRWSARMVELLWRHGGVFDKMVGDCIIGLFGPPFFRSGRREHDGGDERGPGGAQHLRAGGDAGAGSGGGAEPGQHDVWAVRTEPGLHGLLDGDEPDGAAAIAGGLPGDAGDGLGEAGAGGKQGSAHPIPHLRPADGDAGEERGEAAAAPPARAAGLRNQNPSASPCSNPELSRSVAAVSRGARRTPRAASS